jgi:hypothetical protein
MAHNVLGLCEGGEIEAQMFNSAQKFDRIPMLKFSTKAPLLQNPSYVCIIIKFNNKSKPNLERTKAE